MPGRKRKPTALKEILGNPGHRALPENEPKFEGEVRKPKFLAEPDGTLTKRASAIWDEYAPGLIQAGILQSVDAHQFAAWCCLAAEMEVDPKNFMAARLAQMRALASSFGMDASSRARLGGGDGKDNKDPADKYFDNPRPGNGVRTEGSSGADLSGTTGKARVQ